MIPPRPFLFSFRPPVASCRCGCLWANPGWLGKRRVTPLCGYFHHILKISFSLFFLVFLGHYVTLPFSLFPPSLQPQKVSCGFPWVRFWGGAQCSQTLDFPFLLKGSKTPNEWSVGTRCESSLPHLNSSSAHLLPRGLSPYSGSSKGGHMCMFPTQWVD